MQERSEGNGDDDNIISNNIIGMCAVVPGCDPDPDEKRPHEFEIFPHLVFVWDYFVDLCDIPAGDPVFYKTDRCVFGGKCCVFYRGLFPDFNCIVADIHCIRAV